MAGAVKAGEAYVSLALRGRDKVTAGLKRLRASFVGVGKVVAGFGALAGAALGGISFTESIKAASDLEETMNKFNVVFGESSESVKQWSDNFAKAVGRSKKQVADFMASSQDLLVPLGFDAETATGMSQSLTALSVDLASFNNMADADVLRDLQAAMTGSGEVMKKYGVILSEAAVKQELLNNGIDPSVANEQQKALARMNIIMRGTTAAQGDAVRSSGSFANTQKTLMATIDNLKASIGGAMLPTITAWIEELTTLINVFSQTSADGEGVANTTNVIGDTIAAIGSPIQFLIKAFSAVAGVFRLAQAGMSALIATMLDLVALAARTGVAGFMFGDSAKGLGDFAETMSKDLKRRAAEKMEQAGENFNLAFGDELSRRMKEQRDKAKADIDAAREEAIKPDIFASAGSDAFKAVADTAKAEIEHAVEVASPESLESTDVQAFMKFRENQRQKDQQKMQRSLDTIAESVANPNLGIVAVG